MTRNLQLLVKLNIEHLLNREENIEHTFQNIELEKKINRFLTANKVYSEKKILSLIDEICEEFKLDKGILLSEEIYNLFVKYSENFMIEDNYHENSRKLIKGGASSLIVQLEDDGIDSIVAGVLKGENVRDFTELLTKSKLIFSNAALLDLFLSLDDRRLLGNDLYFDYIKKNISFSTNSSENMLISLWCLGLSKKALDNIVRGRRNINDYIVNLKELYEDMEKNLNEEFGRLEGEIRLRDKKFVLNWYNLSLLFSSIGSQTLTIRGSDKSTNGKFFEKLILGSSLSLMGFRYIKNESEYTDSNEKAFYLSFTEEGERETDATILYKNKLVAVDIGFIGGGNPEISADKLTRFRSTKRINNIDNSMVPLVIVDSINNNTVINKLADQLSGKAIEMRNKNWMKELAIFLSEYFNVSCNYENVPSQQYLHNKIDEDIKNIDLTQFLNKK